MSPSQAYDNWSELALRENEGLAISLLWSKSVGRVKVAGRSRAQKTRTRRTRSRLAASACSDQSLRHGRLLDAPSIPESRHSVSVPTSMRGTND